MLRGWMGELGVENEGSYAWVGVLGGVEDVLIGIEVGNASIWRFRIVPQFLWRTYGIRDRCEVETGTLTWNRWASLWGINHMLTDIEGENARFSC